MNNIMTDSIFFGAVISVVGYLIGIFLRKKISVLNPLLVSIIFVIAVIKIFHIDYETYNSGAKLYKLSFNTCNGLPCNTAIPSNIRA